MARDGGCVSDGYIREQAGTSVSVGAGWIEMQQMGQSSRGRQRHPDEATHETGPGWRTLGGAKRYAEREQRVEREVCQDGRPQQDPQR